MARRKSPTRRPSNAVPKKESAVALMWFNRYCELGPEGSHSTLADQFGKSSGMVRQFEKWSSAFGWVARRDAYWRNRLEKQMERRAERVERARENLVAALEDTTKRLLVVAEGKPKSKARGKQKAKPYSDTDLKAILAVLDRAGLAPIKTPLEIKHSGEVELGTDDELREVLGRIAGLRA